MKAAVIREYGKIAIEKVKDPICHDDQVLINVRYASICGSDQHLFKGEFHPRTKLPLVPGHEFAGVVAGTGKNVTGFTTGEKVTVDPIIWCGKCIACRENHYPACTSLKLLGIDMDGGFSEYIAVAPHMVHKIPSHISDYHAALVEILSIGFHAVSRAGLKKDDDILITGSGKVGNSILHAAKTITSGRIFIADVLTPRLEIAKSAFPDIHIININQTDPVAEIMNCTKGKGVDIAFEAVGHEVSVEKRDNPVRTCIKSIKGGGRICVLGLSDHTTAILMKELIWKEAQIIASRVSHGEFSRVIEALDKGILNPDSMITGILDLEEVMKGFELLDKEPDKQLKILIKCDV